MSFFFEVQVRSNQVEVSDRDRVIDIETDYYLSPDLTWFEATDTSGPSFEMVCDQEGFDSGNEWPRAVRLDRLPPDEEDWDDAVEQMRGESPDGWSGDLEEFLLRLSPYLLAPLVVQAALCSTNAEFGLVKQWTVAPGATQLQITEVEALPRNAPPRRY